MLISTSNHPHRAYVVLTDAARGVMSTSISFPFSSFFGLAVTTTALAEEVAENSRV